MIRQGDDGEGGSADRGHEKQLPAIVDYDWPTTPASFDDHVDEHAVCADTVAVRFYWVLLSYRCTRNRGARAASTAFLSTRISRQPVATVALAREPREPSHGWCWVRTLSESLVCGGYHVRRSETVGDVVKACE